MSTQKIEGKNDKENEPSQTRYLLLFTLANPYLVFLLPYILPWHAGNGDLLIVNLANEVVPCSSVFVKHAPFQLSRNALIELAFLVESTQDDASQCSTYTFGET